jgi:hypothetical protein
VFRQAERAFGPASIEAARAATTSAQLRINLGDYQGARHEIARVNSSYTSVLDPETRLELHRLAGWLDYYEGDLVGSETAFVECLAIAGQLGIEHLAESAEHFLGRVYGDLGRLSTDKEKSDSYFHRAQVQLDKAHRIHLKWGNESQRAFDQLRKAQLLSAQSNWREAQRLLKQARELFGKDLAVAHIDLEEAKLLTLDGGIHVPKSRAEGVLRTWAHLKYAKGMSDALRLLGIIEITRNRPVPALELLTAALCIYPFENHLGNRQLLLDIKYCSDLIRREDRSESKRLLERITEAAKSRRGYFAYLNYVSADRNANIERILAGLASGSWQTTTRPWEIGHGREPDPPSYRARAL